MAVINLRFAIEDWTEEAGKDLFKIFSAILCQELWLAPGWYADVYPGKASSKSFQEYCEEQHEGICSLDYHRSGSCIWINYCDSAVSGIGMLASVIQAVMRRYSIQEPVSFRYVKTGEERLPESFDGGWFLINNTTIQSETLSGRLDAALATFSPL